MRSKLSKVEVLELELTYLKERSKYQEDDKRVRIICGFEARSSRKCTAISRLRLQDKDELESQIQTLKLNLRKSTGEIETVTTAKSILENEMASLKQVCLVTSFRLVSRFHVIFYVHFYRNAPNWRKN